jgi:hypothetical protein
MIIGYKDKKAEAFALGDFINYFQGVESRASRRL